MTETVFVILQPGMMTHVAHVFHNQYFFFNVRLENRKQRVVFHAKIHCLVNPSNHVHLLLIYKNIITSYSMLLMDSHFQKYLCFQNINILH